MTLADLRSLFRELADDVSKAINRDDDVLWSDKLVDFYANEAQMEAVRRARLIEDGSNPTVCTINVRANLALYDVDPRVIFLRRVKLDSQSFRLPKCSVLDADRLTPGWEANPGGSVFAWMPWGDHQIRLLDPPSADDKLRLIVVREPLADMVEDDDEPEVERRYQPRLVDWMLYRAFMSRDRQEKYRPDEAKERLASFEAEFGPKSSAIDEKWIHRKHGYDEDEGLF